MNDPAVIESPVLSQVVVGYEPLIDRQRAVTALRLTVSPLRPDDPPEAALLLDALADFWPAEAGRMLLNIAHEDLLAQALRQVPARHLMLEVPSFMAADPAVGDALAALHARGVAVMLQGVPPRPLPPQVLGRLACTIIDVSEDRRVGQPAPATHRRFVSHVQSGVHGPREMAEAFDRGAIAVLGWPIGDGAARPLRKPARGPELQATIELINRVQRQEDIARLEAVLKNAPTLAFRLLRYINSPAFGLRVEVASFRHAVMLLGFERLKRWLSLLLVSGNRDLDLKPLVYAAVRRGLMMEELGRGRVDDTQRSELFICGVFSLLDRMLQEPFADLLRSIPVSEAVRSTLAEDAGPYSPYLALVQAVESGNPVDIRGAADALLMSPSESNRALRRALIAGRHLD